MARQPGIKRPPIVALGIGIVAIVLHYVFPVRDLIDFPGNLTGITLMVLGLMLAIWGSKVFAKHKIDIIPGSRSRELANEGPYRFSRNPMYVGLVLMSFGISVIFGSLIVFIWPILLFMYLNNIVIPMEEALLERTFRKKYEDYKDEVRRWI